MDDTARWFPFRGLMHAENPTKSATFGRTISHCGLAPMEVDLNRSQVIALHEIPAGEPCRTCLVEVATASTSDEPLEHAISRGYIASADMPDLENL